MNLHRFILLAYMMVWILFSSSVATGQGCVNEVTTPGQEACDDNASTTFDVTLVEAVRLEVPGANFITHNTARIDLLSQYISIGTFDLTVYAVTDYEVTANKTTVETRVPTGTTGLPSGNPGGFDQIGPQRPVDIDALLEINLPSVQGDEGDGDDPVPGAAFIGAGFIDLPDFGSVTLWTGGNSEGSTTTSHIASASIRFDLAALENNASGNVYQFTINVRVVER